MNLNPSKGAQMNLAQRAHAYVATLVQLPPACARCEHAVVFCDEDKRFYECMHIVTSTEDYFRWVAVTSGGQRTFFIPVEALNKQEFPSSAAWQPNARTNSFDAILSALNEIALGLMRYNIRVQPFCYKISTDTVYKTGQQYYIWNDNYDRSDYVETTDEYPIIGKPYFLVDGQWRYVTKIFNEGESFESGVTYYEMTRPFFIPDVDQHPESPIEHRVFVRDSGKAYDELSMEDAVAKTNEIIDAINLTNAQIKKAKTDGTLFDLATIINVIIDEVNPFSNAWLHLLRRVEVLEENVNRGSESRPLELPLFVKNELGTFKLDVEDHEGTFVIVPTKIS